MKINWHRQHRWSGIVSIFLLMMFCVSGIVLNHRSLVADIEVSRSWLPWWYEFKNWNGGLMRGTVPYQDGVLIYGVNGIWLTDGSGGRVRDFNAGLPPAADCRQVRGIAVCDSSYYAATTMGIYRLESGLWRGVPLPMEDDERLSDITAKDDTLVVVGRSNLYVMDPVSRSFTMVNVKSAPMMDDKVSLFRTVWMLHSGELFGLVGRLVVDFVAVILIILSITGLVHWLLPKFIRWLRLRYRRIKVPVKTMRNNMMLHNHIGRFTIVVTLLIVITGWCLRPPVMIALALNKTSAIPGTSLDSDNPWHDKLRMLRYDRECDEWLLSTSEGFFVLDNLTAQPHKLDVRLPVSVMGLNVFEKDADGDWLVGSFSGMYRWNRKTGRVQDYFTGAVPDDVNGPPFGKYAVSGYSDKFNTVVEYHDGTEAIVQPEKMNNLPMSIWNVALEAHSGRLFMGSIATYVFVFIVGLIIAWCLWSGWKSRRS